MRVFLGRPGTFNLRLSVVMMIAGLECRPSARASKSAQHRRLKSMTLRLHEVIIPVSDIDQAKTFYGQLLGIPGQRVSPDRHQFDCEGLVLTCFNPAWEYPC